VSISVNLWLIIYFGQLKYKDNAVDLVDEGTTPPQKLVLRTVRAEYTKLAGTPLASFALSAVSKICVICAIRD
jgi:hypothetical protein